MILHVAFMLIEIFVYGFRIGWIWEITYIFTCYWAYMTLNICLLYSYVLVLASSGLFGILNVFYIFFSFSLLGFILFPFQILTIFLISFRLFDKIRTYNEILKSIEGSYFDQNLNDIKGYGDSLLNNEINKRKENIKNEAMDEISNRIFK